MRSHTTDVESVVIDCQAITGVDATGAEELVALVSGLRRDGIEVSLVRMHRKVNGALERGGATESIGAEAFVDNPEEVIPDR